jgi:hypothetical protein
MTLGFAATEAKIHGMPHPIELWHDVVARRDAEALDALLADHVVFHSPVVHTPQQGKPITKLYLGAALQVLNNDSFRYLRQIVGESDAVLEFTTEVDGIHINGVDIIHWNADGKIDDFKVMVRPLKAINLLHGLMKEMLERMSPPG